MTASDQALGLPPNSFQGQAQLGMAAVASPNPDHPPYYVALPFVAVNGKMQECATVWQAWVEPIPIHMLDRYKTNLLGLRAIGIDVGTTEEVQDEISDTHALPDALAAAGIPHHFEAFAGSRVGTKIIGMTSTILPYLAAVLDGARTAATGP